MPKFLDLLFHDLLNHLSEPARAFASDGTRQELKHAWRAYLFCRTGFHLLQPLLRPEDITVDRERIASSIERVGSAENAMVGRCTGEPQVTVPWQDEIVDLLLWNVVREAAWHRMRDSRIAIECHCPRDTVQLWVEYDGVPPTDVANTITIGERSLPLVSDDYRSDCGIVGAHAARRIGETVGAKVEVTSTDGHQRISIIIRGRSDAIPHRGR